MRHSKTSARAPGRSWRWAADRESMGASGDTSRCKRASSSRVRSRMARSLQAPAARWTISRPANTFAVTAQVREARAAPGGRRRSRERARPRGAIGAARRPGAAPPGRGVTLPARMRRSVDLPAPFSPRSRAPRLPTRRRRRRAARCTAPNDLWTSWNSSPLTPPSRRRGPAARPRLGAGGEGLPPWADARARPPSMDAARSSRTARRGRARRTRSSWDGSPEARRSRRAPRPDHNGAGPPLPTRRATRSRRHRR